MAWLQKHVVDQDKAMLEMSEAITRLRREVVALRERQENLGASGAGAGEDAATERPPHY